MQSVKISGTLLYFQSGSVALTATQLLLAGLVAMPTCEAHTQCVRVSGGDRVTVRPFEPPASSFQAALVTAEVAPLAQKRAAAAAVAIELDAPDLAAHLLSRFGGQVRSRHCGADAVVCTKGATG